MLETVKDAENTMLLRDAEARERDWQGSGLRR
jgi:hypothetical protein